MANAVGINIMGWSFQRRHSYVPGLIIMEVLMAIAIVILANLGPYRFPAVKPGKVRAPAATP